MTVVAGTKFDRYEIISPLGAGGMGEVFLARDMRLERKVALKLLLDERTKDDQRLLRFEQEARAASALNHPNIITIYEIGDYGSTHFIATEFIEGLTLRKILADGKMPVIAALDVAIQVASALSAAHEAGIIHRDIKPENVMLRRDGIVKVLDFGLAKLIETGTGSGESGAGSGKSVAESGGSGAENTANSSLPAPNSAFPGSPLHTDPGTVMGTATYMAPEQARGWRVDARADIFSLGVVLYEMVAGRAPFDGPTPIDVMTQVLDRDPRPLTSFSYGAPFELQRIVSKAMRKDREERYQTVKDLMLDLRSLKRELEATTTLSYAANAETSSGSRIVVASSSASQSEPIVVRAISSAEYIVGEIKRHKRGFLLTLVALSLAVFATLTFIVNRDHPIESIAVLPFVTQNDDPNAESEVAELGDAITDSIINNLSQIPSLNVRPRGAVLRYKGREVDPQEAAKALDVHAVLTGRIIRRGDTLQVVIALVDARDNRNLWGQQYNRKISDLLLVQQEIAGNVSDKLRLRLSGEEKRRLEAQQLYVKGRNAWSKRTADNIQEGAKFFEQAIQLDPNYAAAYAGLADCYSMLVNYSVLPGNEAFPKAKDAAEKALALDENLAEAHAARAFIYFLWEWNWAEAGREYRRAIQLNPNYSSARQWYSSLLAVIGQTDEALEEAKQAHKLDSFSPIIASHPAWINYLSRNAEGAIREARQALKLDPNFFPSRRYLALGYDLQGKYNDALAELQRAVSSATKSTLVKSELGYAYAKAGRREEALRVIEELQRSPGERRVSPFHIALIYIGLGENDRAIDLLEKAYDERVERLVWLRADPRFDPLRLDPRFNDLLTRMGLAR
ncbi:MAG TPA: protein kinase [Blastocatellia bacterium]|jgi:Serine/threonine protein kinase